MSTKQTMTSHPKVCQILKNEKDKETYLLAPQERTEPTGDIVATCTPAAFPRGSGTSSGPCRVTDSVRRAGGRRGGPAPTTLRFLVSAQVSRGRAAPGACVPLTYDSGLRH